MPIPFLVRRRESLGQAIEEPTLLAIVLTALALVLLLAVCVAGVVFLPAFGYVWWAFAALAAVLAWLLWPRRKSAPSVAPTGRQKWFRCVREVGRKLLIGLLVCWLGLIVWLAL